MLIMSSIDDDEVIVYIFQDGRSVGPDKFELVDRSSVSILVEHYPIVCALTLLHSLQ